MRNGVVKRCGVSGLRVGAAPFRGELGYWLGSSGFVGTGRRPCAPCVGISVRHGLYVSRNPLLGTLFWVTGASEANFDSHYCDHHLGSSSVEQWIDGLTSKIGQMSPSFGLYHDHHTITIILSSSYYHHHHNAGVHSRSFLIAPFTQNFSRSCWIEQRRQPDWSHRITVRIYST